MMFLLQKHKFVLAFALVSIISIMSVVLIGKYWHSDALLDTKEVSKIVDKPIVEPDKEEVKRRSEHVQSEIEIETETGTAKHGTETKPETETMTKAKTEAEIEIETKTVTKAKTGTNSETETETKATNETKPEPEIANSVSSVNEVKINHQPFKKGDMYYGGISMITDQLNISYKLLYKCSDSEKVESFMKLIREADVALFLNSSENNNKDVLQNYWIMSKGKLENDYVPPKPKTDTIFRFFGSSSADKIILEQIEHRGFIGYLEVLTDKEKAAFKDKDVVYIVSGIVLDDLKVVNDEQIDLELEGSYPNEPEIKLMLDYEYDKKVQLKVLGYTDTAFKLRTRRINNLFKREELHGLHIEFGTDLKKNECEFDKFKTFKKDQHITFYDGLTVVHNYKQSDFGNDIITALETIKQKGLGEELDRQYGYGWATVPYFSVLLICKDENLNLLKDFESMLKLEDREISLLCGKENGLYCDVLDVKVSDDAASEFRVFFAYKDFKKLNDLITKFNTNATDTKATLLKEFSDWKEDGHYYLPKKIDPKLETSVIVDQIKRRGFRELVKDFEELEGGQQLGEKDFYFIVEGNSVILKDFKLSNPEKHDYISEGSEEVKVKAESTFVLKKQDAELHKLRVHRIENLFKNKDLYGLHLEFDIKDSDAYDLAQLQSYEAYTKKYPNFKFTTYDGMIVIHNQLKNNLLELLDGIIANPIKAVENNEILRPANFLFISYKNVTVFDPLKALEDGNTYKALKIETKAEDIECGEAGKKMYCGYFDIKLDDNDFYRFFYANHSLKGTKNLKKHVEALPLNVFKIDETTLFDKLPQYRTYNAIKMSKSGPLSESTVLEKIKTRGFKGYFDDLSGENVKIFEKDEFFLMIPSTFKDINEFKFDALGGIDLNIVGAEATTIREILNFEILEPEGVTFRLRSRKIENVFKQKGLHGLHIEFGQILKDQKEEFENFVNLEHKNRITAYNGVAAMHNYKSTGDENDIVTALDLIKAKGLKEEFDGQYRRTSPNTSYFSVLLVSKNEEILKPFEDKLRMDHEKFSVQLCGKNNEYFCDSFEVSVPIESSKELERFKVFLAYKNKDSLDAFKASLNAIISNENLLSTFNKHFNSNEFYSNTDFRFEPSVLKKDLRKGFKYVVDNYDSSEETEKINLLVQDNGNQYYLTSLPRIDYKTASVEDVEINLERRIVFNMVWYTISCSYKVLAYRIKNIFGRKDLHGIFIKFGIPGAEADETDNADFKSFDDYLTKHPGCKIENYDKMIVMHNQSGKAKEIVKVLENIKNNAANEFKVQNESKYTTYDSPSYFLLIGDSEGVDNFIKNFKEPALK